MTSPAPSRSTAVTAPRRLPLLGHAFRLALPSRMDFVQSLRRHGPVVRIYLGPRPAYVLNSPEALRQLLQVQARKFTKGRLFEKARPFIGNGVLASDGELHRRQRRMLQPAFHRGQVAKYAEQMSAVASRHVQSWQPDTVLPVMRDMRHLTGNLISHILFSDELARNMATTIEETLPRLAAGVNWRVLGPGGLLTGLPTPGNRRFEAARARLFSATKELIQASRADAVDRGRLISLLLAAPDPRTGELMGDDELRDEIITIFIAGVEAMATVLSWVFHLLSIDDHAARCLGDEVDRVLGGRPIAPDDIAKLTYTNAFINEVLRYYTPNFLLMKNATESVDIEGTRIPAGAELMYSPATLHRDPVLYPDPDRFDPGRWLGPDTSQLPRCAFIPFGIGAHQCLGDSFAVTELHVVLSAIITRWRLSPASARKVRKVATILVHPPRGFAIRVTPRETGRES